MGQPYQPQDPRYGQPSQGGYPPQQWSGQQQPGGQPFRPNIPIPAMNMVPQNVTGGGRIRPPAEHLIGVLVWTGYGLFNVVMAVIYFIRGREWATEDAGLDIRRDFTDDSRLDALISTHQTGYTLAAFGFLGFGLVVLVLAFVALRGMTAGRLALPPIGLFVILFTTTASDPFHPQWVIAAVAVVLSVLLFLPRSNSYFAAKANYG